MARISIERGLRQARGVVKVVLGQLRPRQPLEVPTDIGVPAVPPAGQFLPLRALFVRRYARSAFRSLRPDRSGALGLNAVAEALWREGYLDYLDCGQLSIASMVSRKRLDMMRAAPRQGSNQTYLMNTLAVELFVRWVEEVGEQAVKKP